MTWLSSGPWQTSYTTMPSEMLSESVKTLAAKPKLCICDTKIKSEIVKFDLQWFRNNFYSITGS